MIFLLVVCFAVIVIVILFVITMLFAIVVIMILVVPQWPGSRKPRLHAALREPSG